MSKESKNTTVVAPVAPVTNEQMAAALTAGDYSLLLELTKRAKNESKLNALAAQANQAIKDAKANKAKIAETVKVLVSQLTAGTFETWKGLWLVINTTMPGKEVKDAKVSTSKGTNGKGISLAVYSAIDTAGTAGISKSGIVAATGANENTVGELLRPVKLRPGYTVTRENGNKLYFAPVAK